MSPWKVFEEGDEHCVHKIDAEGNKGKKVACHDSRDDAVSQVRALYASEDVGRAESKMRQV